MRKYIAHRPITSLHQGIISGKQLQSIELYFVICKHCKETRSFALNHEWAHRVKVQYKFITIMNYLPRFCGFLLIQIQERVLNN
jgi:hypothetical protein